MLASVLKYSDTGGRGVLAPRALPTSRITAQVRRKKLLCSHTLQQQKHELGTVANDLNYHTYTTTWFIPNYGHTSWHRVVQIRRFADGWRGDAKQHFSPYYEHLCKEFMLFPISAEKHLFMHPSIVLDRAPGYYSAETNAVAFEAIHTYD